MQRREDVGKHMDRVARGAAIHARMQVAVGRGDDDLLADEAAQHGRDRRPAAVPHAGVADQGDVGLQFRRVGLEEGHEVGLPDSSSPSKRIETCTGSVPVTAFQARQASRKVINWPLSSEAPRAGIPSSVGAVDETRLEGRRSQSSSGSTGWTS